MSSNPYLTDRASVADAVALIAEHGDAAASEAAHLAHRSRYLGNHVHFCRWRQVAHLIALLSDDRAPGTVH